MQRKRGISMSILYGLLVTLYILICVILVLLVLIQKGKGSMGLGAFGGGTQMLFGGSGGQDLFQKITWGLGGVFLMGSLLLALMKSSQISTSKYISQTNTVKTEQTTP